jgi:hypothetical protein
VDDDDTGPEHAKDLLNEHKDRMSSEHIRAAEDLIEGAEGADKAQAIADEIFDQFDNITDAKAFLRSQSEYDEHRQPAMTILENRYNEASVAEQEGFKRARIDGFGIYAGGIDRDQTPQQAYDSIPQTIINAMDGADLMALQNRVRLDSAGKKVLVGDKNVFRDVKRWIRANPDSAKNEDFQTLYTGILEDGQIDALYTMAGKGKDVLHKESTMLSLGKLKANIDPKKAKEPGTQEFEDSIMFDDFVDENFATTDGTPAAFKEVVDRATIEIITARSYLPGVGDKTEQAWRFGQPGGPFIEGIPATQQHMIDEYASHIVNLGLEPTKEHLQIVSMLVENNKEAVLRKDPPQDITRALILSYSTTGQKHPAEHESEKPVPVQPGGGYEAEPAYVSPLGGSLNFPLNPKYK